jgi:thymidylate synthase
MTMTYDTVDEAYLGCLFLLINDAEHDVSPRGQRVFERRDEIFRITKPRFAAVKTGAIKRDEEMAAYTEREIKLYREGTLDAARWRDEASKFWWELRDSGSTINSNYGWLTQHLRDAPAFEQWRDGYVRCPDNLPYMYVPQGITQWEWARTKLKNDEDSRQAVMLFLRPCHQWAGNKDFPCTLSGVFAIRDYALHYSVVMRSQDIWRGWPYDIPYFVWQLEQMAMELNMPIGTYTHHVHSLHLYERDWERSRAVLAAGMAKRSTIPGRSC